MKNKNIYKLLYGISVILIFVFIIFIVVDYCNYNPVITSAPFYVYIIIRGLEFIFPSIVLFCIARVISTKLHNCK